MIQVEGGWKLCHAGCESPASRVLGGGGEETWSGGNDVMSPHVKITTGVRACGRRDGVGCWCDGPEGLEARAGVGEVVNQRA